MQMRCEIKCHSLRKYNERNKTNCLKFPIFVQLQILILTRLDTCSNGLMKLISCIIIPRGKTGRHYVSVINKDFLAESNRIPPPMRNAEKTTPNYHYIRHTFRNIMTLLRLLIIRCYKTELFRMGRF